ncbi:MAG: hypothetical protein GY804_14190 [Alphaproteobacteria bacterium]|nr:hypothetical protein [Alphaproteobacteria bacterium]
MQIECPNCSTGYEIPDDALDHGERLMLCNRCSHQWAQTLENLLATNEAAIKAAEKISALIAPNAVADDDLGEIDTGTILDGLDNAELESKASELDVETVEERNPDENTEEVSDVLEAEVSKKDETAIDMGDGAFYEAEKSEADEATAADEKTAIEGDNQQSDQDEIDAMFSAVGGSEHIPSVGSETPEELEEQSLDENNSETEKTSADESVKNASDENNSPADDLSEEKLEEAYSGDASDKGTDKLTENKGIKDKLNDLTEEQKKIVKKHLISVTSVLTFCLIIAIGFTENSYRIPILGSVYQLIGLSEEIVGKGLEFNNVRSVIIKEGGVEYFEVKGYVLNATKHRMDVPLIKLEIYDEKANVIKEKKVVPHKDQLAPGVNIHFVIRETKDTNASRISVTFAPLSKEDKKTRKENKRNKHKKS